MSFRSSSVGRYGDQFHYYERSTTPFSTKLRPSHTYDRYSRARSVGPYEDISSRYARALSMGRFDDFYRRQRAPSVGAFPQVTKSGSYFDYLRAKSQPHYWSFSDTDYYDRYSEKIDNRNNSIIDGYYKHFRPYYWYQTAPRSVYYYYPYSDWRYTPRHQYRSPSLYSYSSAGDAYVWKYHDALSRVLGLQKSSRDLDYLRAMRDIKTSPFMNFLLSR